MGAEHQVPHQQSSTEDVLPAAAEEVQPAKDNDGALLHCHHQVHPHLWYAAATAKDKSRLQRIIRYAEKVTGCKLLSLGDLHSSRALKRTGKMVAVPSRSLSGPNPPAT